MGRKEKIVIAVLFTLICFVLGLVLTQRNSMEAKNKKSIRIGICLYRNDDTFISDLRSIIEEYAKEYEKETGLKIYLDIVGAQDNQNTQDKQVNRFASLDYDVLCINPVDRTDTSEMIESALTANIPVVFFNREPVEDDIRRSKDFYYVGADPKDSAVLEGKILVDAYQKDPHSLDFNQDGQVNYVLLEGEPSHQDAIIRTRWSVRTLEESGIRLNKLTGAIANWERTQGAALMEQWLKEYPGQIEIVLSNNDDMALGAIAAIERAGDTSGIKLVGIDGTPPARLAVQEGKLFGSVAVDKKQYAKAILEIAIARGQNQEIPEEIKKDMKEGRYYMVSHMILTQ